MRGADEWPVVLTDRCADRCRDAVGLGSREAARTWLARRLPDGRITDVLPAGLAGRRSPSGWFLVVGDALALPLAADRGGRPQWIATDCVVPPARGERIDPATLSGPDVVRYADLTRHAVERFQQRCGAHPDLDLARRQLERRLAGPGVRATTGPPSWCRTQTADFFVVAGDEMCLPARWGGGGGKEFSLTTCMHRAGELFALPPGELVRHCRIDRAGVAPHDHAALSRRIGATGRLSWHPPRWAPGRTGARWWILLDDRCVLPVSWDPGADRPLTVLGVAERRGLLARLRAALRGLSGKRPR